MAFHPAVLILSAPDLNISNSKVFIVLVMSTPDVIPKLTVSFITSWKGTISFGTSSEFSDVILYGMVTSFSPSHSPTLSIAGAHSAITTSGETVSTINSR